METNPNDVITSATNTNILVAIARSGSNKNKIAKAAGVPLTTFSRKINGHGDFSLRELGNIADALGLTLDQILPMELISHKVAV